MLALLFVVCLFTSQYVASAYQCPRGCRPRLKKMATRLKALEETEGIFLGRVDALETAGSTGDSAGTGAVYIRWGRTKCPSDNELIYEGRAAGTNYNGNGRGCAYNYLCLPKKPQWGPVNEGWNNCGASLQGAKYEVCDKDNYRSLHLQEPDRKLFSLDNNDDKSILRANVPCVACQATTRQSHAMLPAQTGCPQGWTKEYQGIMMANYRSADRFEYICVDQAPEAFSDTGPDEQSARLYATEVKCGQLPCPQYPDGQELACVVCTQ